MKCPSCGHHKRTIYGSRMLRTQNARLAYYKCNRCSHRFKVAERLAHPVRSILTERKGDVPPTVAEAK